MRLILKKTKINNQENHIFTNAQKINSKLDLNNISLWSEADYSLLTASIINLMNNIQVQEMMHPEWIPETVVAGLDNAHFSAFTADQFGLLNIIDVPFSVMKTWGENLWAGLKPAQLSSMSLEQINSFQRASWLPV